LRSWEPGGIYHLAPKGNDGRPMFYDDVDRTHFIVRSTLVLAKYEVTVLGYCLMTNHAHLLVRSGKPGLSCAMQALFGGYSRWWNRRHGRRGHLHHNRCHVADVKTDAHLRVAAAYIDLNPVRARLVERPEDWLWSSYRAHVGLEFPLVLLSNDSFLRVFARSPRAAKESYRQFVRDWQRYGERLASLKAA
jgi:putative transposase